MFAPSPPYTAMHLYTRYSSGTFKSIDFIRDLNTYGRLLYCRLLYCHCLLLSLHTVAMENEKLDRILERLDDITKLRNDLNQWKKEITNRLEKNEESLEFAHKEIKDLKETIVNKTNNCDKEVSTLRNDFVSEGIKARVHSYKYNLLFIGIPGDEQNKWDTEYVVREFMKFKLDIGAEIVDYMTFADIHRIGPKQTGKSRNIVVRFVQMSDRDRVLKSCKNLKHYKSSKVTEKGETIKYQTYKVQEHLPRELVDQKNELWTVFKQAARHNHRRQFRVIGSRIYLFVNGQKFIPGVNEVTNQGLKAVSHNTHTRFQSPVLHSTPSPVNSTSSTSSSLNETIMETEHESPSLLSQASGTL